MKVVPVAPETLQIQGHALINTGLTNMDGSTWGTTVVSGKAGQNVDVTPLAAAADVTFTNQAFPLALQSLTVMSNSATQIDAADWACVKATNDYVIVQANISFGDNAAAITNNPTLLAQAAAAIVWTGGQPVLGNPFQRAVSKTTSIETNITATLGSSSASLNVWIVWATMQILTIETNPAPVSFANAIIDPPISNMLGIVYYDNATLARGQVCIIGTVTPSGIHTLIPGGWFAPQNRIQHVFSNGYQNPFKYDVTWTNDGPINSSLYTTNLDNNDKIYALDAPNIPTSFGSNTLESYLNLEDSVTWNGQICSSTNNYWHWQGRSVANQVPSITFTDLGTNLINLPTNAFYPPQ